MIRGRFTNSGSKAANEAERLLETARVANLLLRRGATMNDLSALLKCSNEFCELALQFFRANDGKKLRALVEDWPLAVIRRESVCEDRSFDTCKIVP